ncbi:MAG TPA: hypothetical protein VN258_06415 [Mobilitalea sp.]|nr:hypothetical protein [Mobilitalea sp.]
MKIIYTNDSSKDDALKMLDACTETKIGNFILSKCEKELQNNEEYAEMQEDLNKAYECNNIEQYRNIFGSIMELRKTIFYRTSAKYIHYLLK